MANSAQNPSEITWYLRTLGPPLLLQNGTVIHLETRKALALLVYVCLEQKPLRRDKLAALFWPETPEKRAKARLRRALWAIRTQIPAALLVDRQTISYDAEGPLAVDAHQFRQLLTKPYFHDRLQKAVDLYTDAFMAGFSLPDTVEFDRWQDLQRQTWQSQVAEALQALAAYYLQQDEIAAAQALLQDWLLRDPTNEAPHRELMQLHALAGDLSAAIQQYESCVAILEDAFDLPPAPETEALYQMILVNQLSQPSSAAPVVQKMPGQELHLLTPNTPFIGRQKDLAQLKGFLDAPDIRLITIVGPGGMGKTRLALEAVDAHRQRAESGPFSDGIHVVSLAAVSAVSHMPAAIAQVIGLPLETGQQQRHTVQEQILDFLREKNLLLLLDNLEHLLENRAFIGDILKTATAVKILVTSRELLELHGEQRFFLSGLDFPAKGDSLSGEAYDLFTAAARRVRRDFALTPANVDDVNRICHRVAGMPLALELAAGWVDLLTPAEILEEIGRNIDFLSAQWPNIAARHRSMRALFETSWNHLHAREQTILAQLAWFQGGFTRTAAAEVTGVTLADLARLRSKSLLQYDPEQGRYTLHELLRQFAAEKLQENSAVAATVVKRHSAHYLTLLRSYEPGLKDQRQQATLSAIEQELENYLLAWQYAVAQRDLEIIGEVIHLFGYFFKWNGRFEEGKELTLQLQAALAGDEKTPPLSAGLQVVAGSWAADFAFKIGEETESYLSLLPSLDQIEALHKPEEPTLTLMYAFALHFYGRLIIENEVRRPLLQRSREKYKRLGRSWESTAVLLNIAPTHSRVGNFQAAEETYRQALQENDTHNDPRLRAEISRHYSGLLMYSGRQEESHQMAMMAISAAEFLEEPLLIAETLGWLGVSHIWFGEFVAAEAKIRQVIALLQQFGRHPEVAFKKAQLFEAFLGQGKYEEAKQAIAESLEICAELDDLYGRSFALFNLGGLLLATNDYEEAVTAAQESIALKHEIQHEGEIGWSYALLSIAYLKLNRADLARSPLTKALQQGLQQPNLATLWFGLLSLGFQWSLEIGKSPVQRGAAKRIRLGELFGLLWEYPFIANSKWVQHVYGDSIQQALQVLPPSQLEMIVQQGKNLNIFEFTKSILKEF